MEPNLPLSLAAFGDGAAPFAAAGVAGALPGELFSRLLLVHGDTRVHPTAFEIFAGEDGVVILVRIAGSGV